MGAFKSRTIVIDNHITCTKCGETKDTRFFSRIKESNSFRSTCTQCRMGSPTSRYKKQDQVLELYNNGFKECVICKNILLLEKYHNNKNTRFGLSAQCKNCSKQHGDVYKEVVLYNKYKLEKGSFEKMLKEQNNKCAICYNTFGETKNTRANVDHCHESTKVRMLLCGRCNLTLGLFNDNINTLHSAINYLQKYHDDTTIEYYI